MMTDVRCCCEILHIFPIPDLYVVLTATYATLFLSTGSSPFIFDISLLRITSQENVHPKNNIASDNTVNIGMILALKIQLSDIENCSSLYS